MLTNLPPLKCVFVISNPIQRWIATTL